jgi:hypothetical protein
MHALGASISLLHLSIFVPRRRRGVITLPRYLPFSQLRQFSVEDNYCSSTTQAGVKFPTFDLSPTNFPFRACSQSILIAPVTEYAPFERCCARVSRPRSLGRGIAISVLGSADHNDGSTMRALTYWLRNVRKIPAMINMLASNGEIWVFPSREWREHTQRLEKAEDLGREHIHWCRGSLGVGNSRSRGIIQF